MTEQKRKRGRPCGGDNLIQFQIRLEPELIQQLKCRIEKGKVSTFIRDAIVKELKFKEVGA